MIKPVQNEITFNSEIKYHFELTTRNCCKFLLENSKYPCNRDSENNTQSVLMPVRYISLARERDLKICKAADIFETLKLKKPRWIDDEMEYHEMIVKNAGTESTFSNGDMNYIKGALGLVFTFLWIPIYISKYKFEFKLEQKEQTLFSKNDKTIMNTIVKQNDNVAKMLNYLDPTLKIPKNENLFITSNNVSLIVYNIGIIILFFLVVRSISSPNLNI